MTDFSNKWREKYSSEPQPVNDAPLASVQFSLDSRKSVNFENIYLQALLDRSHIDRCFPDLGKLNNLEELSQNSNIDPRLIAFYKDYSHYINTRNPDFNDFPASLTKANFLTFLHDSIIPSEESKLRQSSALLSAILSDNETASNRLSFTELLHDLDPKLAMFALIILCKNQDHEIVESALEQMICYGKNLAVRSLKDVIFTTTDDSLVRKCFAMFYALDANSAEEFYLTKMEKSLSALQQKAIQNIFFQKALPNASEFPNVDEKMIKSVEDLVALFPDGQVNDLSKVSVVNDLQDLKMRIPLLTSINLNVYQSKATSETLQLLEAHDAKLASLVTIASKRRQLSKGS
jgi:hypothetical protein